MKCWNNIPGNFYIEAFIADDGHVYDTDDGDLDLIKSFMRRHMIMEAELDIEFLSSGHNDPGSRYGGRDNLGHPPSSEEERVLSSVKLHTKKQIIQLPDEVGQQLFEKYETDICQVEIEA